MEKEGTKKGKMMVKGKNEYIRFDWAAKYMLRSKADFAIFEGLINVLIGEKVEIVELLESESNQEHKDDKFNRVNEFNKLAVTPLEEWLEYLKDEYIRPDTTVPGLMEARERLEYLRMSEEERRIYDHYLDTLVRDTDVMKTKLLEAEIQGIKKGEAKGIAKGIAKAEAKARQEKLESARKMKADKMPFELISKYTGLSTEEIESLS